LVRNNGKAGFFSERLQIRHLKLITVFVMIIIRHKEGGSSMGEIVHTSHIQIVREKGPTRRAMIEGFSEPIYYGVHGGIKKFYQIEPEKEHAATLDHIIAATGG